MEPLKEDNSKIIQLKELVENKVLEEQKQYDDVNKTTNIFSSQDIIEALSANEDGDAWIYTNLNRTKFCYDHSKEKWFKWSDHHWEEDLIEEALASIDCVVDEYSKEVINQSKNRVNASKAQDNEGVAKAQRIEKELIKRIKSLQTVSRKKNVLRLSAAGSNSLGITGNEWDINPLLFGCKNGVLELETAAFRSGKPEDYIKTIAPAEWKGIDSPAPNWEKFLYEIFDNDEELINYIQRVLGYSISGLTVEHIILILWGIGRNGKGTFIEIIKKVIGSLAGPIQAEMLLRQTRPRSSANPSPDIMNLRGKRLVWGSETDEGRHLDIGKIKWLSGGDTLTGRHVHGKREVEFIPTHKIFLLTNHKPHISAEEYAAWERIFLIPFTLSFVDSPMKPNERKRDPYLTEKLFEESSGILAWLVSGFLIWSKEGLNPPNIVKEATREYQKNEDIINQFLEECCEFNSKGRIQAQPFHTAYKRWCESNNYLPLKSRKFSERMLERFERVEDSGKRYYVGVILSVLRS